MSKDIKVIITQQKVVGKAGFGIPLIVHGMDTKETEYKEYSNIEEIRTNFSEESAIYKAAILLFMQQDKPAKIAICSTTERTTTLLDKIWTKEWRQLIVTSIGVEGEDTIKAISDYVESRGDKIYYTSVKDVNELDILGKNDRTYAMVYGGETEYPEAALVGATAALDVGSFTYKNMILKGMKSEELSDAQIRAIHEKNAYCFLTKAGENVTSEGKTLNGEYLDIIDSKDWIVKNIEYQAQSLLNQSKKVPYTDVGIAQMESVVVNVLKEAHVAGMIANDNDGLPAFSTDFARRSEVPTEDRENRIYNGGKFSFTVAGAIHEATVHGELLY